MGEEQRPPPRQQLHGYISTPARDGWYQFAAAEGINVTALMEAIGLSLAEQVQVGGRLPPWLRQLVTSARAIASSRSSRHRE